MSRDDLFRDAVHAASSTKGGIRAPVAPRTYEQELRHSLEDRELLLAQADTLRDELSEARAVIHRQSGVEMQATQLRATLELSVERLAAVEHELTRSREREADVRERLRDERAKTEAAPSPSRVTLEAAREKVRLAWRVNEDPDLYAAMAYLDELLERR